MTPGTYLFILLVGVLVGMLLDRLVVAYATSRAQRDLRSVKNFARRTAQEKDAA